MLIASLRFSIPTMLSDAKFKSKRLRAIRDAKDAKSYNAKIKT